MTFLKTIKFICFCSIFLVPNFISALSHKKYGDGLFTTIHVITVNPKINKIVLVRASPENNGRETVQKLVNKHQAIAGVNGGFWKQNGMPAGILKIDGVWYGFPFKPRGALGWSNDSQLVLFDRVMTNYSFTRFDNKSHDVNVYPVTSPPYTAAEDWDKADYIVGGTPLLIADGNIISDYSPEQTRLSFLYLRHARTAVGVKPNGHWVFAVVDSKIYNLFGGMTIKQLAKLMYQLGCVNALNLDGGSSSTMVLNGKVINDPHGELQENNKYVRAVSDAILIMPKE